MITGNQKVRAEEIKAYGMLGTNMQYLSPVWARSWNTNLSMRTDGGYWRLLVTSRWCCVVYQPRNIGTKEMAAGHSQAAVIIPMAE